MSSLYSGYNIKFLPIEYSRRIGKSNIKPIRDFLGFSMLIVRVASYFEPLRFFLPIAYLLMTIAVVKGIRDFVLLNHIGVMAAIMMVCGVQIFMTGILAEVVVRRTAVERDQ